MCRQQGESTCIYVRHTTSRVPESPPDLSDGWLTTDRVTTPTRSIGDAYTNSVTWTVLEDLVDRMAGQSDEKEGVRVDVDADAFEAAGVRDVRIEELEIDGWLRGSASVATRGHAFDQRHQALPFRAGPTATSRPNSSPSVTAFPRTADPRSTGR